MEPRTADLAGPVHYLAADGGTGPTFVFVHGLGGSHVNWLAVAPPLAAHGRGFVLDLPGFGRTPPAGRSTDVQSNAGIVGRFLAEVVEGPAILVGNSMGGLIAQFVARDHPDRVAGLVLVNPSLPLRPGDSLDREIGRNFAIYAVPGLGERFLRRRRTTLAPERLVADVLDYCCVDPSRVPRHVIAASVDLARERRGYAWADGAFLQAARSLLWIHASRRSLDLLRRLPSIPTLLVHGAADRLVPLSSALAASRIRPDWTLEVLDGIGHVPQLEAPDRFVGIVEGWLAGPGRRAARAATPVP